jgi:hypothetical protein
MNDRETDMMDSAKAADERLNPLGGIDWSAFAAWPSYRERMENGDCDA